MYKISRAINRLFIFTEKASQSIDFAAFSHAFEYGFDIWILLKLWDNYGIIIPWKGVVQYAADYAYKGIERYVPYF